MIFKSLLCCFCVVVPCMVNALPPVDGAVVRSAKKSLLKPTSFAKTVNDLSMGDRFAIVAEGFLPYESVYDASGRCIENCAYPGITLKQEVERTQHATQQLAYDLCRENGGTEDQCRNGGTDAERDGKASSGDGGPVVRRNDAGAGRGQNNFGCPIQTSDDLRLSSIPGERTKTDQQSKYHAGVDMAVGAGTPVYASYGGVVKWAGPGTYRGGAGCYVEIKHTINNNYYYTRYLHLKGTQESGEAAKNCDIKVSVGDTVTKGQQIANSGDTGKGTGPHLHYDMYTYDNDNRKMHIDLVGSYQNWDSVNSAKGGDWYYGNAMGRQNWLGRTYLVAQDNSNEMIKNCRENPVDYTCARSDDEMSGVRCSDSESVCWCIVKNLTGCIGVY